MEIHILLVYLIQLCFLSRYGPDLRREVLDMAEGIDIGEMHSFDLVPSAEAKKRPNSSDGSE